MYSLDTLSAARDLEAVGFNPQQAEAIVAAISRADEQLATKNDIAPQFAHLVTKAEIAELKGRIAAIDSKVAAIDSKVAVLDSKVEAVDSKVASLRSEFRWVFGFLAPFILAMAARMFGII